MQSNFSQAASAAETDRDTDAVASAADVVGGARTLSTIRTSCAWCLLRGRGDCICPFPERKNQDNCIKWDMYTFLLGLLNFDFFEERVCSRSYYLVCSLLCVFVHFLPQNGYVLPSSFRRTAVLSPAVATTVAVVVFLHPLE